ncbi:MAG: hypothetical protein Q9183_007878 [Haloplaca sp. 2 TL-2023]
MLPKTSRPGFGPVKLVRIDPSAISTSHASRQTSADHNTSFTFQSSIPRTSFTANHPITFSAPAPAAAKSPNQSISNIFRNEKGALERAKQEFRTVAHEMYLPLNEEYFREEFTYCEFYYQLVRYIERRLEMYERGHPLHRFFNIMLAQEFQNFAEAIAEIRYDPLGDDVDDERELGPVLESLLRKYMDFAG